MIFIIKIFLLVLIFYYFKKRKFPLNFYFLDFFIKNSMLNGEPYLNLCKAFLIGLLETLNIFHCLNGFKGSSSLVWLSLSGLIVSFEMCCFVFHSFKLLIEFKANTFRTLKATIIKFFYQRTNRKFYFFKYNLWNLKRSLKIKIMN